MKPYFSHDEGARNDPKLIKVLMRLGQAGKGVYWDLVEMLYEQGGYLLLEDCESHAFALRTECELITRLVYDFDLFATDGTRFWSSTCLSRMEMRDAKKLARAEAGAKGGKIKAEREAAAKALLEHDHSNASQNPSIARALLPEILAIKEKEIKGKEKEVKPSSELLSPREEKDAEQFTFFWQVYPRKESRMDALKAFNKLSVDEQTTATQSVIEWFARRTDWIRADGSDFRPYASSWLNQKRWTDLTEITITQPPIPHGQPSATANHFAGYQHSGTASSQYAFTDSAAFNAALQVIKELG